MKLANVNPRGLKLFTKLAIAAAVLMFVSQGCKKQQIQTTADTSIAEKTQLSSELSAMAESAKKEKKIEDPADAYFKAYLLVRESEKTTNREESIHYLQEAIAYFLAVKSKFPDWKPAMVDGRIARTQESLDMLLPPKQQ